ELLMQAQRAAPKTRYHLSGAPVIDADTARIQQEDIARFIPIVYGVMAVLIFIFVRRLRSVLAVYGVVTLSLLAALATLAAVGSSINNCSSALPPVIASLAVALMLHYFSELSKHQRESGLHGKDLARYTLAKLAPAVAMAALTTAVGFGALGVSMIPALRDFGLTAALTMIVAFLMGAAVFALLARSGDLDRIVAPQGVARRGRLDGFLQVLASLLIRRRFVVLGLSLAFVAFGVAGVPRVVVDMNPVTIFAPDTPVRVSTTFIDERLRGSALIVVAVGGPQVEHFTKPRALSDLDRLKSFLLRDIGAKVVTSPADFVRLMHRELFSGDAAHHTIPPERQQVAQLLLINNDTRIDEFLDHGRRWARVTALLPQGSSFAFAEKYHRVDAYLAQHFPASAGFVTHATGRQRLSAGLIKNLVESQITGLSTAAILIFALIFVVFRSLRTGLVALLPNILPVVAVLAGMGWLGINLDAATVLTATLALGIAVDDTVHVLSGVRTRLAVHGDLERSVREALRLKGPAILWTTLVVAAGFSVLMLSQFEPTRHFGILITIAMVAALLGDLLVLPAILLCTRTRLGVVTQERAATPQKNEPSHERAASLLTGTTQQEG
ncbi:MAG: MMPL family transporter, partial [Deltaproteobacteria bacterium]|nr:MMPL family transporter [Deltaproteobacteria bacterium]